MKSIFKIKIIWTLYRMDFNFICMVCHVFAVTMLLGTRYFLWKKLFSTPDSIYGHWIVGSKVGEVMEKAMLMLHGWTNIFCSVSVMMFFQNSWQLENINSIMVLQIVTSSIKQLWLSFWRTHMQQLFGSWKESELCPFWNFMFSSVWLVASSAQFGSCFNL